MAQAGNVVLAANYERTEQASYELITLSVPIGALAQETVGMGIANFPPDADGAIRSVGAFSEKDGDDYPTFALTVASTFAGKLVVDKEDIASTGGSFPIHFRGAEGTFPTVSLYGLFTDELAAAGIATAEGEVVDPEIFRDGIVLVG